MSRRQGNQFPVVGASLAVAATLALLLYGTDPILSIVVLVIWLGTLVLATARPPEPRMERVVQPFTHDSIRELVEHSATPLLLTERDKIVIANRAARDVLGAHVVGQDPRVIFRQPEAVELLANDRNDRVHVRGLARRRDLWQFNRYMLENRMAVIELINQTSEADISRAHTDFVANASHELRTPLASIIGYVETLSDDETPLDSPTAQKFLGTILREAKRLQSLVSDLMSLSRVEAEKHDRPSETIELGALVERAARDAAGSERVERLDLALAPEITVCGDTQQLEQLVRNLVDNAFKYGASDGKVTVRLEHAGDAQARIAVVDQGEGIPAEHLPHLTRRFYRTDPGRSRQSGGTGLGLAIVKHIVERHQGRLDIESQPGEGTSVIVRLPVLQPAKVAAS